MRTQAILSVAAILAASSAASAALTALTTFGNGNLGGANDGYRAANEIVPGDAAGTAFSGVYGYLGTGNTERGMSYNPATGHVLFVSRQNRNAVDTNVRVLDGQTGADLGGLDVSSGVVPTGGTFKVNMVDVGSDGAIYVGNLSASATDPFKVYRWANESAPATLAHNAVSGLARTGDSFAAFGSGASTKLASAGSTGTSASSFAVLNTADGSNFTSTAYTSVPGTTTTSNDYRLSLTFVDSDTIIGTQGGNARMTDFAASATVTANLALGAAQRGMDYAVIGGIPLLAVIDSNSSLVQIYDITNPAAPVLFDQGNNTTGLLAGVASNANGTGAVAWGNISGDTATLYAMNSNQGIQAFSFAIPEPGSIGLLGVASVGLIRRRKA